MTENHSLTNLEYGIRIYEETDAGWVDCGRGLDILEERPNTTNLVIFSSPSQFMEIDRDYEKRFQPAFWSVLDKDLNGAFHCQYQYTGSRVTPKVSWSCYKLKKAKAPNDYYWKQISLHIDWDHQTGRQLVYIFNFLPVDEQQKFLDSLPSREERRQNPFCWHAAFTGIIVEHYDQALWAMRDLVRGHEKARRKDIDNDEFFPGLHEIARHLSHYNEIIDVAGHTLQRLVQEQDRWRREDKGFTESHTASWLNTNQELLRQQKVAHSLKARAKSVTERHLSEINLGFNVVSQADAKTMRTVAFVSMLYLPGTFISGVFGTNFFGYQATPSARLASSSNLWVYFAFAVPLTLMTMAIAALYLYQRRIKEFWTSLHLLGEEGLDAGGDMVGNQREGIQLGFVRAPTTMERMYLNREATV